MLEQIECLKQRTSVMFMAVLVSSGILSNVNDPIITLRREIQMMRAGDKNPFIVFFSDLIWAQTHARPMSTLKMCLLKFVPNWGSSYYPDKVVLLSNCNLQVSAVSGEIPVWKGREGSVKMPQPRTTLRPAGQNTLYMKPKEVYLYLLVHLDAGALFKFITVKNL